MDDETPEMEAITAEMRDIMRAWIASPESAALKERYVQLQAAYQQAFEQLKQGAAAEPPGGTEAVHQA